MTLKLRHTVEPSVDLNYWRLFPPCNRARASLGHVKLLALLILAAGCAAVLAACGSSKPEASKKHTDGYRQQYAAARCMRNHGVSNFPDPQAGGGFSVGQTPGNAAITVDGITFSGPAFTRADKVCNPLGLSGGRPPISEQQKETFIDFAECMRRHGLKRWADPTFPPGGGIMQGGGPYSRSDPKVELAAATCNKPR